MSTMLRSATLVTIVGGLCFLTACSSGSRPAVESAPAVTTAPATPSAPVATTAPATPAATTATATATTKATATAPVATVSSKAPPPTATAGADPCPVTAARLLEALRADPAFDQRAAKPAQLQDARCESGYAIAGTVFDGSHQTSAILFGFQAGQWRPLNLGSADYCEGFVPADVAPKLRGC